MRSREKKTDGKIEGSIRFYAELNDFLKNKNPKREIKYAHMGRRSVKDLIESFGVPHVEVDLILVNGQSAGFGRIVEDGDRIGVYPMFERLNVKGLSKLRDIPLRETSFVLDVHLGKLARHLRLLGFDADYGNLRDDDDIVRISNYQGRIILTCDRQMLKRSDVARGMLVHSRNPRRQVIEVLDRLDIRGAARPFSRCLECGGKIEKITEENEFKAAFGQLPQRVKSWCNELYICRSCGRTYWKGGHYEKMIEFVEELLEKRTNDERRKETMNKTVVYFENKFEGRLVFPEGELSIGLEPGTVAPYDMFMGALAGCLYSTFLDVVEKQRGSFEKAEFHVEWEKRTEVPTTLKKVKAILTIIGADDKDKANMEKAAKLAAKYCSIYQTISFVADMSLEVIFV